MTKKSKVLLVEQLDQAFSEKVRRIALERGLSLWSADYLTRVLVQKNRPSTESPYLFDLYKEAIESEPTVSAQKYKQLGDQALFVLGVFPQSIDRRGLSKKYYEQLGSSAYSSVAGILNQPLYAELSAGFGAATWTLHDVFEEFRLESRGEEDVLALYEEWLSTGSLRVLKRLQELGFHFKPEVLK